MKPDVSGAEKSFPAPAAARIENGAPVLLDDGYFMRAAIRCAQKAADTGDVPVGAVAVRDGEILAKAWNQMELLKDATAHAEILLISALAAKLGDWRLDGIDLYVTKEPCAMCAGAMVNSRVRRLIFGQADPRSGAAGSALDVTGFPGMLHRVEVTPRVLEKECAALMKAFFRTVRGK